MLFKIFEFILKDQNRKPQHQPHVMVCDDWHEITCERNEQHDTKVALNCVPLLAIGMWLVVTA